MRLPRITMRRWMLVVAVIGVLLATFEAGRRWERASSSIPAPRYIRNDRGGSADNPGVNSEQLLISRTVRRARLRALGLDPDRPVGREMREGSTSVDLLPGLGDSIKHCLSQSCGRE